VIEIALNLFDNHCRSPTASDEFEVKRSYGGPSLWVLYGSDCSPSVELRKINKTKIE
jgi:hypothetical protein